MNMKRRDFLRQAMGVGITATIGSMTSSCTSLKISENTKKPNLVYIMVDEMPQRAWSLGDTEEIHTPNLERLAKEGLTFNQCVSNNPICVPHRAIQLTGLMSHQNGMRWNGSTCTNTGNFGLHPSNPSWAREFKKAGYKTGYVGKWHLYGQKKGTFTGQNGNPMEAEQVPPGKSRFGFDDLWAERYYLDRKSREKAYFDKNGKLVHWGEYPPAGMFETMFNFIDEHRNENFAVMCCPNKPHPPFGRPKPPQKWTDYYEKRFGKNGKNLELRKNVPPEYRTPTIKRKYSQFYAHISAIDELVGKLMDKLENLGIAEDTIVIFTSDHGELLRSHGERWKRWPWDESILVPFIIKWPGHIPPARKSDEVFSSIDIAPTLLGLSGIKISEKMQGTNMADYMKGKTDQTPPICTHHVHPPSQRKLYD